LRYWPAPKLDAPLILCLHGVESHGDWFEELAAHLHGYGYAVLAWDRPGFGRSRDSKDVFNGDLPGAATLLAQFDALERELIRRELGLGGNAWHLCGLSWGGLAALFLASRRRAKIASLSLLAPGLAPRLAISWRQKLAIACARPGTRRAARPFPLPITAAMFTARLERQRFIEADPFRTRVVTRGFCAVTLTLLRAVRRLRPAQLPPTAAWLAETDEIIANARVKARLNRLGAAVATVPQTRHSLVFEAPQAVAAGMHQHVRLCIGEGA
jgi:alpha-beta hydrolase superfamily lysophospholipase